MGAGSPVRTVSCAVRDPLVLGFSSGFLPVAPRDDAATSGQWRAPPLLTRDVHPRTAVHTRRIRNGRATSIVARPSRSVRLVHSTRLAPENSSSESHPAQSTMDTDVDAFGEWIILSSPMYIPT